jgi:dolichyl-diphosphooligosaccharide--protein glycosyltransferase
MRKRSNPIIEHHKEKTKVTGRKRIPKSAVIAVLLISVFALTLFFNFYFNYTSGVGLNPDGTTMQTKYLLSGPDPYYNMRTVRWTLQQGHYPWGLVDPLLEYPMNIVRDSGSGVRPPLMNMMAIAFHFPLTAVMPEMDAVGFSMQFLPALFGALLIFPVYYFGKELLNWKAGLVAALFIALIPVHLASGHGSAFTLFDHDALILLLFGLIYLFYIRSIKAKSNSIGILYALLSGTMIGAMIMLWVEARYTYMVLIVFFIIQAIINIFLKKPDVRFARNTAIALGFGFVVASPMLFIGWGFVFRFDISLIATGIAIFFAIYYLIIKRFRLPWILSIPILFGLIGVGAATVYFMPQSNLFSGLGDVYRMLFGNGIYGSQTALTIAEARTYDMSRWVMSFGPTFYLIALLCGLPYIFYKWVRTKRYDVFFVMIWFVITTWLNTIAGRFINDYVPSVALLAGIVAYLVLEKVNVGRMIKSIRDVGGGFHGLRKGIKIYHVLASLFVVFMLILPNAFTALDAAIPAIEAQKFGRTDTAFGLSTYKELYWTHALAWLADQDTNISDMAKRPGFISWWDYGFQEVAVGDHPTVADNYQRGVQGAANFQTAPSEKDAIAVLAILLLRADVYKGSFSNETDQLLHTYLPDTNETIFDNQTKTNVTVFHHPANDLENIVYDPVHFAPSYGKQIGNYKLSDMNALYQDSVAVLNNLSDEQIVLVYQALQEITGYSIRYYGTEGYDMDIFNVFSFLSQKGTFGYSSNEDQYFELVYTDKDGREYTVSDMKNITQADYQAYSPFNPKQTVKDAYYQTMVVRSYMGTKDAFVPGYGLKHFIPEYISPYPYPGTSHPAVIISKYYPGGLINGTVLLGGMALPGVTIIFMDKNQIPHDIIYSDTGKYSLISLPGNFSLRYYLGQDLLKETNYNGTSAISEQEADREVPYTRTIDESIEFASINGHLANGTKDMIIGFNNNYYNMEEQMVHIDADGNYSAINILPSEYTVTVYEKNRTIQSETFFIAPGNQTHNISVTMGVVYGYVNKSLSNMTLKYTRGNLDYNATTRYFETPPLNVGIYPIGVHENESSTIPTYNLTMVVAPGAKEFDINATP